MEVGKIINMVIPFAQNSFAGGMNLLANDTAIGPNQYVRAQNVRNRDDGLEAVFDAEEDTTAPKGLKQGIFAYENYVILFNNGAAYVKDILVESSSWTKITDFAMSISAPYIWAEAVPASTFKYERKLQDASQINGTDLNTVVDITTGLINATSAALVCQDGSSQPWLIFSDGTAREAKRYDEWTKADREYVPIMRQMKYYPSGILFGVAKDGVTLYRSVSGRPIDFVVNVKRDGDKGGDADTVAYSPGVNQITALNVLKSGELFVGTKRTCHPLDLNFNKTIFAEPTFTNIKTFSSGVVNQHSFLDILTDYLMIDKDGIRSWDAIFNEGNEGRNSLFSRTLAKALANKIQGDATSAAILFDNYAIFSIDTIYGYKLAIYDTLTQLWVSFDDFGIGAIKQFAIADQSSAPKLYAISSTKLYTLYSSSSRATATLYSRAADTSYPNLGTKLDSVYCTFDKSSTNDTAACTAIVDNVEKSTLNGKVYGDSGVDPVKFNFIGTAKRGKKVQAKLTWQNDSKLTQMNLLVQVNTPPASDKQITKTYATGAS